MANEKKCFDETGDSNILNKRPGIVSSGVFLANLFFFVPCIKMNGWEWLDLVKRMLDTVKQETTNERFIMKHMLVLMSCLKIYNHEVFLCR